jgi:hypothetical protein
MRKRRSPSVIEGRVLTLLSYRHSYKLDFVSEDETGLITVNLRALTARCTGHQERTKSALRRLASSHVLCDLVEARGSWSFRLRSPEEHRAFLSASSQPSLDDESEAG